MPEIAEVARIVHYLRQSLVGRTLEVVKAQDDASVFGKVGTSGAEFQKALMGKKVLDAGQQGKYFWLIMSSPPHPVFHFGMTGWLRIRGVETEYYRPKDSEDPDLWPPKYWKFTVETKGEPKVEAAFTDARRFGRIRLVDCAAKDIRNTTPLKENGPDPVIDKDKFTAEWLEKKMRSKHVPIKALLLDQANISGIGNWVGDEVLYNAKLHPEQYSDTFSSAQVKQLHSSIMYVCQTAVDLLGVSSKFPESWLFMHRWSKGKKEAPSTLPNGAKITFLTVGGRTSCVVPSVQKKTGAVAGDVKGSSEDLQIGSRSGDLKAEVGAEGATVKKRKAPLEKADLEDSANGGQPEKSTVGKNDRRTKSKVLEDANGVQDEKGIEKEEGKSNGSGKKRNSNKRVKKGDGDEGKTPADNRRRSGRNANKRD